MVGGGHAAFGSTPQFPVMVSSLLVKRCLPNHVNLCLNSFFSLFGWGLATEKDAMFLSCARILGAVEGLASEMVVKIYSTSERKEELCKEITSILERGSYTTSVLCSLRGRLLFAKGQVFGRVCYRHMKVKVFGDRVESNRNRKVDRKLKNALEYTRDRVDLGPPRVIQAARPNHCTSSLTHPLGLLVFRV